MGSGTTCVASLELNRKFMGIERDENYFKISEKRLMETENNGNKQFWFNKTMFIYYEN